MSDGTVQWFRYVQLVVGAEGQGLSIANWYEGNPPQPGVRISFEVVKTVEAVPNTATIKVYNLNEDHVSQIQDEYTDVFLHAGYAGSISQIFAGTIQYVSHYHDGADYITEITCGDGDRDYRNAYVNITLNAGSTDDEAIQQILGVMPNTREGTIQTLGGKRSRGKVIQGPARDLLTQIARTNGANWSIQDGRLHMIRTDENTGVAAVLNTETGLLQAAERNEKGVSAKCLLNSSIVINGAIKLDNNEIRVKQPKQKALKRQTQSRIPPATAVRLDPDGIYKVIKLTHTGDTMGSDWFTAVECLSQQQPIKATTTKSNAKGVPPGGIFIDPTKWIPGIPGEMYGRSTNTSKGGSGAGGSW